MANDRRLSLAGVRSLIENAGDSLDYVKIPDHYGLIARYSEASVKEKIALYHENDISTSVGGTLYEVAAVNNMVERFLERVAEIGFRAVEVSEDLIEPQAPGVRKAHIARACQFGLEVFTEVGRKLVDKPFDPIESAEIALSDLDAGASHVVVENSDLVVLMQEDDDRIDRFVDRLPLEKLMFEIGPNERMRLVKWILARLGPEVNIENIEIEDVGAIAAMRSGLHRNVDFTYFTSARPQAAAE